MAFHEQGASGVLPHPQDRGHARSWNGTAQKLRCRRESPPTKCLISPAADIEPVALGAVSGHNLQKLPKEFRPQGQTRPVFTHLEPR
jgi:hypothetical protein